MRPNVRRELGALAQPSGLLAMATTVMGAGAMFTLYTYVTPILEKGVGASTGFVTLSLIVIGLGFTVGNWLGGRLADWSLDGATAIFLGLLTVVMLTLPLVLTSKIGAVLGLLAWGIAAFAIVSPVQTRVMRAAAEAHGLASSVNVGAFNLRHAIGAALGGSVLSLGFGYKDIPLAGAALSAGGLVLLLIRR